MKSEPSRAGCKASHARGQWLVAYLIAKTLDLCAWLPYPAYRNLYWMNDRISGITNLVGVQNTTAPVYIKLKRS